ncbi:acetyl-CoA carboxylase biotin carboxylase subunit, partial [Acinetobacter baumannii]
DKLAARRLALAAGLPVLPGGEADTPEAVRQRAAETGYPVLLTAVAGGGGRGLRPVGRIGARPAADDRWAAAARQAFGDGA